MVDAIRASLIQGPDAIVVSEMKSNEVANLVLQEAQTGQFMLSTMYSESAIDALVRLQEMGSTGSTLAKAVTLITHQRLVRRLCKHCKTSVEMSKKELIAAGFPNEDIEQVVTVFAPNGCDKCYDGYKGRMGIFEVLVITPEIGQALRAGSDDLALHEAHKQLGFTTITQSGLQKVRDGTTSLQELQRVLS